MILAFDIVREKMPEVKLSIMGNQEENPEYYEVIRGLQPGDKVIVSSYETYDKVQELNIKK